jgi:hypothetical protein
VWRNDARACWESQKPKVFTSFGQFSTETSGISKKKLEKQENHGTSWSLEMLKMFQVGNIEDLGELTNRNCN